MLHLINAIEKSGGHQATIRFKEARKEDIKFSYATVNKAKKELNFESTTDLFEGICELMTKSKGL